MNKILEIKFGSHLYGTDTEESDLDLKGIYIPNAREIVLSDYKKTICSSRPKKSCERNTKDDVDIEIFSLDRFLELLCDGQTVALDMLFAPPHMVAEISDIGSEIMFNINTNKDQLLSKNVNAFVGYARQQAAKYGIKGSRMNALKIAVDLLSGFPPHERLETFSAALEELVELTKSLVSLEKIPLIEIVYIPGPNKITPTPHLHICGRKVSFHATVKTALQVYGRILDGYGQRAHKAHLAGGVDWKALSHAVRVNGEAKELLESGSITFPRPDRDLLLKIKLGLMPYEEVSEIIEKGLVDLLDAQEKSNLRPEPNREWAKDFISKIYIDVVKNS